MPQIVETDIGEIEFPDDYTQDQMRGILREKLPSLRERVSKGVFGDLASRLPRDVAVSGASTVMGAVRGRQLRRDMSVVANLRSLGMAAAMSAPVGEEHAVISAANKAAEDTRAKQIATREQRLEEDPLYQFGKESQINAREFYETNPTREGSIPAMLSQGVASLPPLIAAGAAGPLAPAVAGMAYGAMAGQQGAEEAISFGQPEKADEAFILFAGLGALSEAALGYPMAFLRQIRAARQAGVDPVQFGRTFRQQVGRKGAEGFVREAAQEGLEQAGQNVVASDIVGYDPTRPTMQGVPQAAAIGGVIGGGLGAVGGAAMALDEARARRAIEAQVPAMLREITAPQPFVPDVPVTPEQRAAEAAGLPIPLTPAPQAAPIPALLSPTQPTAEQIATEEAAAVAAIRARRQQVDPYFAEEVVQEPPPARRRSPATETKQLGYTPPVPESTATINEQMKLLREGKKKAVLLTPGELIPELREGEQKTVIDEGTVIHGPAVSSEEVISASRQNRIGDLLGYGVPAKPEGAVAAITVTKPSGVPVQEVLATAETAGPVLAAAEKVEKPGDTIEVKPAIDVVATRLQIPPPVQPVTPPLPGQPEATTNLKPIVSELVVPQPQETPNAIPVGSSAQIPAQEQTQTSQEVVPQIRDAERPAVPQTKTPQAQGTVEQPVQAAAKAKAEVQDVAQVQGPRAAKEIKSELVARLEEALQTAPPASDFAETSYTEVSGKRVVVPPETQPEKITIEIPGDGTFTIARTKEAIEQVLKRARRIATTSTQAPSVTQRRVTGEQARQFAEEARMSPEEIEAFRPSRPQTMLEPQRPSANIKLLDTPQDQQVRGALERAKSAVVAQLGPRFGVKAFTGVSPALNDESTAVQLGMGDDSRQAIESAFGVQLIFFDSEYPVNGLILDSTPGTVFVNIRSQRPVPTVVAHELMEWLRLNAPQDYARFSAVLAEERINFPEYAARIRELYGADISEEEVTNEQNADFLAYEFQNPYFWQRMADRLGSSWRGIGNRILFWLKGLLQRIRGFETSRFFKDVERAQNALADVMARYAQQSGSTAAPISGERAYFQLDDVFRSKRSLEDFIAKPTISPEEAVSLRRQAGTQTGLVPDAIASEVQSLNPDDAIEKRMVPLLDFVLKLHGMAPALELQRVLADPNIPEDTKQAAISGVLLQIEQIRSKTNALDNDLQTANAKLARAIKNGPKITAKRLVEARSKQIADNLITGYRAYLTAQAANLPADQNLAAARSELIRNMVGVLDRNQNQSPDATMRAIQTIAERIDELPVNEGPQAVADAIRQKDILRGVVGESTIDLLTADQPGGLPALLVNPDATALLRSLSDLQKKAATYAKQIEVVEQAFRGKGEPTPVELKKFADTYRKFRNKQADAAKAIREMDKAYQDADDDVQVYGRSHDILDRLQNSPQFKQQFEAAVNRPGGEIFRDILDSKNPELEKEYTSPLVQQREDGTTVKNKYRVFLAPDREADESTLRDMQMLVAEIDEFLQGDVNPVERQTWETRRDYITRYLLQPKFSQKTQILQFGPVNLNPFSVVQLIAGGRARGPRSELEKMAFRAANEANNTFRVADQALVGYKLISNNREIGDAATKVATLKAVESHGWNKDQITIWDETVLNPILASGQTAGQMRLKAGDFIPGTGVKITPEDMDVALKQKRYSQGIVQTTQGTAKGLPGLLIDNPILIKTTVLGRKALRGAISPGPSTMARRFSVWSKLFADAWTKATPAARRRMVTDGEHFEKAVLGYISTTNPEFNNTSSLKPVYEAFAARAKEDENYQVQSLDQLLDRLAEIAVQKRVFQSADEAIPRIEGKLLEEIGQHAEAIQKHFAEEGFVDDTPQTVMQYASAKSAFTTARKNMLAPDPYYDYTLTHDSDRIGFVAAGYQQFQLRQIDSLKALKAALDRKEGEFKVEIRRLQRQGMSRRKAAAKVQKKSDTQLDRTRFSYLRLHAHKRVIEKVLKDLSENVIDVRDPNDSAALTALARVTANLSSSLLSSPTAMANNLFGGIAANSVILRNLGRATLVVTPLKATAHTAGALVKKVLLTFAPTTAIGKVARSNLPVVKDMATMVDNQLRNWTQQYLEMQELGLVAPTDMRNRMRAQSALRTSAGSIEREPTPMIAAIPNWLESLPGLQQFIGHLRDKVPRIGDEVVNMGAAGLQTSEVFDFLKLQAVNAFEAREAAGDNINASDYFTTEQNLLSPKELGMVESTGYRDSDSLRQQFEIVGNLDGFLRDYYNRQKAAPEGQKHTVPLFENPADEGAVLYDMNAHGNIATAGFTPPSMAGVGQRGLIKKMLFMFQNYVLRQAAQAERLADKDLRDPRGWREAYALWGILATLIVWALAGMLATETGVPATKLITGRSPSRVTAANVIADPDAAMLARYVGMALGNNLPYYGQVISQVLGNPGYGSKWDAANLIPIAGLVRDVNTAITRTGQTGDPVFPAVDFLNRWLPPVSPVLRLLPEVQGDIEARNAARALRVVGPSEGMELAGGGGGQSVQTPASAAIRRLMSAAYRGDQAGIQEAYDAAVREKTAQGSADPERAVLQSLASREPARMVFGRAITSAEEARLIGRMSGSQRASYSNAQDAFSLINQTLGTQLKLTSEPKARSATRGQASRRALFTDRATPIFSTRRSRRRRLGSRRGSAFRRLQIRGSSRRRRRSPARVSFSA